MIDNYFLQLIIAFVPALIYISIIYLRTNKLIDLQKALAFFFFGFCSILFLIAIQILCPSISYINYLDQNLEPTFFSYLFFYFIQVGFTEELSKFTMFFIGLWLLKKKNRPNTLFSYMFYSCIVGASFGMIENFVYFIRSSKLELTTENSLIVLMIERSSYPIILHMTTGLIAGYFYALSTLFKKWVVKIGLVLIGIGFASLIHGFYNYQLKFFELIEFYSVDVTTAIILISSLYMCYAMANELASRDKVYEKLISFKWLMNMIFKKQ